LTDKRENTGGYKMNNAGKIAYFLKTILENRTLCKKFLENGYDFDEAIDLTIETCKIKAAYDVAAYEVFVERKI
jgi:hypothetical protein